MERLTLRALTLTPVVVPVPRPLVTKVVTVTQAPMLLIDLETEEGVTGRAYLFGYLAGGPRYFAPLLEDIGAMLKGQPLAPAQQFDNLTRAFGLMGKEGIAAVAIAGFDMAAWDALARAADLPLARFLGGTTDPVKAYNSNGLGIIEPAAAAEEAIALRDEGGFDMVKLRMGRDRLEDDLEVFDTVREAVGDDLRIPVDFNQSLDNIEAARRGRALDERDVYWIEEPVQYDDWAGQSKLAAETATPIQIGENFWGPAAMARALDEQAMDYVMPDVMRIGGVTGWLRAMALAEAARMPLSSHLFPEISAHLLAVTPTRHYLEYMNWADPILAEPYKIKDGHLHMPDRPGVGLDWDKAAVKKYAAD
jgi:mandelate racemase